MKIRVITPVKPPRQDDLITEGEGKLEWVVNKGAGGYQFSPEINNSNAL